MSGRLLGSDTDDQPVDDIQASESIPAEVEGDLSPEYPDIQPTASPILQIHDDVDPDIRSVFAFGFSQTTAESRFKYRWALLPNPQTLDNFIDKCDGFEVNLPLSSDQRAQVEANLGWMVSTEIGGDKIIGAFERGDFYLVAVESGLLSAFELIHNDYGIEYPLARKLALEFHQRATAVAASNAMLFRDRPDRSQSASQFLLANYGERLLNGDLYQNELRRLDPTLMKGLDNEFGGRRDELADLIPTRRVEVNMRLGPNAEQMSVDERRKALNRILHLGKK
ncbi:MAG: hypothetical protein ABL882_03925 [Sphingopyxis sp.]